jgi:hypothetical protein
MGGDVIITGNGSVSSNGVNIADLIFDMNQVKYVTTANDVKTEIIISGKTTYKGGYSDDFLSIMHQSNDLHIKGSVSYKGTVRNIDDL